MADNNSINNSAEIAKDYNGAVQTNASGRIDPATVSNATPTILGGNMRNPDDTIAPDFSVKKEDEKSKPSSTVGIDPNKLKEFFPQDNVLSKYSSMSYSISIYVLTHEQMIGDAFKQPLPSNQLIMQTGGIQVEGRNKFFNHDFFINDVEISSIIGTNVGGRISNSTELEFKIAEPYGISLVNRIAAAVYDITGKPNYPVHPYLMIIKFYGYDETGQLATTDAEHGLIVTKYIPFRLISVTFRVNGKTTEYVCKAIPWAQQAVGETVGSIQTKMEISATTVEEFLNHKTNGLAAKLNEYAKSFSTDLIAIPDEYYFNIAPAVNGSGIGEGLLKKAGDSVDKRRVPFGFKLSPASTQVLPTSGFVATNERIYSISQGTSIINLLDTLIQTSSYITGQQTIQMSDNTETNNRKVEQEPVAVLQWFRINTTAEIIGYDEKRRTNACKYTYIIEPYSVHNVESDMFNVTKIKGVHKAYKYWFTGENTEIISYEQDYNYAYYTTFGKDGSGAVPKEPINNTDAYKPRFPSANPEQSTQSATSLANKAAAEAASVLYSIGDIATVNLKVFGDPAWLQSNVYAPLGFSPIEPFTEDGSVNGSIGEVFFDVNYKLPTDYDLTKGIQDPKTNNFIGDSDIEFNHVFNQRYRALTVKSHLNNGMFTQDIEGVIVPKEIYTDNSNSSSGLSSEELDRREKIRNAPRHQNVNKPRITGLLPLPNITKLIKLKNRDELKAAAQDTIDSATVKETITSYNPYARQTSTEVVNNKQTKVFNPMTREWEKKK